MNWKVTCLIPLLLSSKAFGETINVPLKWGYVDFPPFHYSENNEVKGLIAEKVANLFHYTGHHYKAYQLPNKRAKLFIDQGKVDFSTVIDSFIMSPDQFIKSKQPIYDIELGALCDNSISEASSFKALKNTSLILISGYSYGLEYPLTQSKDFNVMVSVQNHASAVSALKHQRAKCALGYRAPFEQLMLEEDKKLFNFHTIDVLPVYIYLNKQVNDAVKIMTAIDSITKAKPH
jgi:hypothetical protein